MRKTAYQNPCILIRRLISAHMTGACHDGSGILAIMTHPRHEKYREYGQITTFIPSRI